jgi:hypothetical protein
MNKHTFPAVPAVALSILGLSGVASAHGVGDFDEPQSIPNEVTISDVRFGGSGCPDGSVSASLSPDYQALTLIFDEYMAEVGPEVATSKKRLFCHIVMQLHFPAGFSYSLVDLTYQGFASLDAGLTATQKSTYFFQGDMKDDRYSFNTRLYGQMDGDYVRTDSLGLLSWSSCDKKRGLNIVTSVQLDNKYNRKGTGMITLDSVDGQVTERYGLRWRKCS